MTRLLDDAHAGRLCLGTLIQDVGTFALEPLAKAGMSFVFLDMMFGTLGWNDVRHMTTAARAAGMTSCGPNPELSLGRRPGGSERQLGGASRSGRSAGEPTASAAR